MKTAIYAGTFDPPTLGHMNVIEQASALFDNVIVIVGNNNDKSCTFSQAARHEMLKMLTLCMTNVRVEFVEQNEYMVNIAKPFHATVLVRGIRNAADFESEQALNLINTNINPDVKTIFLMPPAHLREVSSSAVRKLIAVSPETGIWLPHVCSYVPPLIIPELLANYLNCKNLIRTAHVRELLRAYAVRPYHNFVHIGKMLESAYHAPGIVTELMQFAILMHDVIYASTATDNEENSAKAATRILKNANYPDENIAEVTGLIMATKHDKPGNTYEQMLIADLDLEHMASHNSLMAATIAIRQEYNHVSLIDFIAGRKKFLETMLTRKTIFQTEAHSVLHETAARRAIQQEIKRLA
jgi:pantetheine-phosphate adenylyltransferase